MREGNSRSQDERRVRHSLREVLDELIDHVRTVSNRRADMSAQELGYSQERLQWLADEVWRLAMRDEYDEN